MMNPEERLVLLQTWIDNRMERDRTLLALSAGGLGLVATLMSTLEASSSRHLVWYVLASISFLVAVFAGIGVFHCNAAYVEKLRSTGAGDDKWVNRSTGLLVGSFCAGVTFTLALALGPALIGPATEKGEVMHENQEQAVEPTTGTEEKGLGGLGDLLSVPSPDAGSSGSGSTDSSGSSSDSSESSKG